MKPEQPGPCKCQTWATDDVRHTLLSGHATGCQMHTAARVADAAIDLLGRLTAGIEAWASYEAWMPTELWDAYIEAKTTIGEVATIQGEKR